MGLGALSTVHAQTQYNIDTEMDKILNAIDQISKLSDEEKKVRKNIVRLSYGLNNTSSQIGDNRTAIEENKASLSTLTRKSFQNQADIVRNNASIEDLYAYGEEVAKSIGEIHTHNEEQNKTLENLITNSTQNTDNIAKNKANIQTLTEAQLAGVTVMEELNKNVEENKRDLSAVTGKAFKNQVDIQRNNDSIEDLYEANAENVERLTQVDNNVFVNRLNIQELKRKQENDIKDVVGMQNAIAEQADINKNDIQDLAKAQLAGVTVMEELNKNVEENKADIANNNTTLAQHTKQINENKQAIEAKLGGKVDAQKLVDLEKKVKKNQDKVDERLATVQENYSQQVQSVDNKIGMVDTRVNALDDKVENSMAAQAALNGLFQPYNVGKVSVSVAVGAYGSKSAIAVGAGYRVNPHLAFKGGAAINTSGSRKGSYNLGINYEF